MLTTLPPPGTAASVAVVGRGRLGRVLARALRAAGVPVLGPTGRGDAIPAADIVLLCVPDAAIGDATAAAAGRGRLIGHTSGATPLGAADFGLHPLQTFTGNEDPAVFHGITCAVAGRDEDALATATGLATLLGAHALPLADGQRAGYHAAASIASNFLVTLADTAEQVAASAGIAPEQARAMLAPLVRRTVENWAEQGPERALTGPVRRGDTATVERQRAAVATRPELLVLFDALVARTSDVARRVDATDQHSTDQQDEKPMKDSRQ
ncbi:DUF2520 domain-containing protein [Tersicoccus sp. MR15.9]|uniref:Rossmann-like and DUF2520 domain-containing protein n=1 Tax=Tersicoccus mangrovi TaxID=3121635 RepID=UPI002FE5BD85